LEDLADTLAYIQEIKQEYEQNLKSRGTEKKFTGVVKVLYPYRANQSTELDLKEGDLIQGNHFISG
jgi:hypothetical protein